VNRKFNELCKTKLNYLKFQYFDDSCFYYQTTIAIIYRETDDNKIKKDKKK